MISIHYRNIHYLNIHNVISNSRLFKIKIIETPKAVSFIKAAKQKHLLDYGILLWFKSLPQIQLGCDAGRINTT